jgi:hypothetical protein
MPQFESPEEIARAEAAERAQARCRTVEAERDEAVKRARLAEDREIEAYCLAGNLRLGKGKAEAEFKKRLTGSDAIQAMSHVYYERPAGTPAALMLRLLRAAMVAAEERP